MNISNDSLKMSSYKFLPPFLVFGLLLLSGCVTTRKSTYLQEYNKSDYSGEYTPPEEYLIQPNDNLYVRISTPDPRLSEIFNPSPGGGGMTMGGADATQLISYPVQLDGTVALPYIGLIEVAGKTLTEAKFAIEAILVNYVSDGSITVRLVNNYVTLLGEVASPGMYSIPKDRLNVFQALALAGDVAPFSNRYKVSIVRQTMTGSIIKEFDITDRKIVDSEFYYVMPNDVIYVKPMKGKFFGMTSYPYGFILSTVTTAVSLFLLIQNQILIQQR